MIIGWKMVTICMLKYTYIALYATDNKNTHIRSKIHREPSVLLITLDTPVPFFFVIFHFFLLETKQNKTFAIDKLIQ